MAKLTRDDILNLARLARLHLTEVEIEQFQAEITAILQYVAVLQDVKLDNISPTFQVTGLVNVMRPDEVQSYGAVPKDLLSNVPATHLGHIKVKRMLT